MLEAFFEILFEIVFETIVEFAEKKKGLGLVLFLILAGVMSFLSLLFLVMTVKQVMASDFMYAFFMLAIIGLVSVCTYKAWKKVIQHMKSIISYDN